jgi:hypothetical protein
VGKKNNSKVDEWLEEEKLLLLQCWARDYTNEDIADKIGIGTPTLWKWRKEFPQIEEALKIGREIVDYKVENALLKIALGFKTTEVKTIINGDQDEKGNRKVRIEKTEKEITPNVTAILAWLNNRKSDDWKRNRDNVMELNDNDSNITVNIVRHNDEVAKQKVLDNNVKDKKGKTKKADIDIEADWDADDWDKE